MNIYDFDGTIYAGDSTIDFYLHCLKRYPSILQRLPKQLKGFVKYKTGSVTKDKFKELFFSFLPMIPEPEAEVSAFWDKNQGKIKKWYLAQQREDDLIISASPYFLLKYICDRLNINNLIASDFDIKTGQLTGKNCYGEEKLRRFRQQYGNNKPECFYSDSRSDQPMADISNEAFLVTGDVVKKWL